MDGWIYSVIIYPILFILPAYAANGAPVLFGGGTPLDLGRRLRGRPIFGKHKTIRGLLAGICSGIIVGFAESLMPVYGFMLGIGLLQALGTHAGDLLGSFIKRQRGMKEGKRSLLTDQYLFLTLAILFSVPLGHLPGVYGIIFLFVLTGIMHPLTNFLAHMLRLKEVPW
jgi:CDP-2,3-bis-(O-geranylgeranyl)-sn-glycerol synthase